MKANLEVFSYQEEKEETSGMSVGAIVGIVVGVLFLFVAVIILLVFLRKTQR